MPDFTQTSDAMTLTKVAIWVLALFVLIAFGIMIYDAIKNDRRW